MLQLQATFDPLQSTRTFEVLGIDYSVAKVAPALNRIVAAEAPDVRFVFGPALPEVIDGMPDSLRSFDGIILPHGYLADQSHVDLYTDEWVCIVDTNSDISGRATVDELVHRRWVHTLSHQEGMTLARRQMQAHGLGMTMGAVTPQIPCGAFSCHGNGSGGDSSRVAGAVCRTAWRGSASRAASAPDRSDSGSILVAQGS